MKVIQGIEGLLKPESRRDEGRPTTTLYRLGAPLLRAHEADTFWKRFRGLHRLPVFGLHDALIIRPCQAIHTFQMRIAIDVVYLDRQGRVMKVARIAPGRIDWCFGSHVVVEMAAGTAARLDLDIGHVLVGTEGRW